jgi:hypothetical protein
MEETGDPPLSASTAPRSVTPVGSTLDWVEDDFAAGFVLDNPNARGACGCARASRSDTGRLGTLGSPIFRRATYGRD